jgi:hypothetical protein
MAMVFAGRGNFIQKGGRYFVLVRRRREFLFIKKKCKDVSSREHAGDRVKYPFASGAREKPMMQKRHPLAV